jgi:preprotein translocase subunit SecG
MPIVIWLLTFFLVLNSVLLILLVLIQLPKKEAGLGQAFGGAATDALFGAGSGNALTKMTKYSAGVFFVLTLLISILQGHQLRARNADPRSALTSQDKLAAIPQAAAKSNASAPAAVPTNFALQLGSAMTNIASNVSSTLLTNAPSTKPAPAASGTK